MEPNENQGFEPEYQPESIEVPENTQYHAAGVGQVETVGQDPYGPYYGYSGQGVYQQPQQPAEAAPEVKPQKKKNHKVLKALIAAGVAVVLVITSCGVTAGLMESSWQKKLALVNQNFRERVDALEDQLQEKVDNLGASGDILVPGEGMTPAQVYQKNVKSVVAISCTSYVNDYGQSYAAVSSGSGFVLTEDGYIVTNHHVIDGATQIEVITYDDASFPAVLIGSDASNDIALLKVEASGFQPVTIGSSDALPVGSQVVAVGNALGELSASLTVGYVSGKDRLVTTDGSMINMLQTDAAINSGNSGGPLFNMKGEVVGITTAKYSGATSSGASIEGIGFAIPIDDVIGMLEDLKNYGYITGVQLGVMVRNLDAATIEVLGFSGVYVDSVVADSCAQKAGIQGRDIILEVGGYKVTNLNELTRVLRKFEGGQEATVKIWRGGRELLLTILFDAKTQ